MLSLLLYRKSSVLHRSTFFLEAIFAPPPIVLAATIYTLPWKVRVGKCPFTFCSQAWCGDFQFTTNHWQIEYDDQEGVCQHKNSVDQAGTSHWNKLKLAYLAPARIKVTHLMSIRPKMEEPGKRLKTRSLCMVCRLLAMLRNGKWQPWDLAISVRKSTKIAIWVLVMHCLLIEETRLWNADSKAAWCFINAIWCCLLARKLSLRPSRNSVPERGDFSLEQVGIDISGPCTHESNSLDLNTAKNGGTWKKAKDKVTLCGVPSSCNAQKWKVSRLLAMFLHFQVEIKHVNARNFSHVLSNMLLKGSSARVLQYCPLPTDTGDVFNSFSKQSCLHTNCSLSSYLCPAGCFQEILFKQARTCHWNQLNFSDISASWAHERISLFVNTGNGIRLSYVYVWSDATLLTLT